MKSTITKILFAAGMIATCGNMAAQNTYSGYFLDNYTYRYQMNPAMGNDKGFVSFPGLGNVNVAIRGNFPLNSLLFKVNGETSLFTNPQISTYEVLNNLENVNKIGASVKENVISAGFKAFGGYNTISLNAVAGVNANIPKSLISLMKEGDKNSTYDITDFRAQALGYAELALGHSHDIKAVEGLRVGGTLKFLVGIANLQADFNKAHLTRNGDKWIAVTNADIYANLGGLQYDQDINDQGQAYISGVNMDGDGSVGPNGFGLAFDLGAEYKWNDFKFSLAFLDLGFISFNKTKYASTNGDRTFETKEFVFSDYGDSDSSFDDQWETMSDGLSDIFQLQDMGETGSHTRTLGATINIGVDYTLPVYRNLHFGLMNTTVFNGPFTFTEFRLSANVAPVKMFSADVNLAAGTYGVGFGWMLNFHTTGFNLFAGMDRTLGKLCKQGIPLNSNGSFNFGINFPF